MKSLAVLALVSGCFSLTYGAEHPTRVWTALAGNTVEASFVKVEGAMVFLKLENGKEVRVAKSKLCESDRSYLEALEKPAVNHELPFEYGAVSQEQKLSKDDTVSYYMYVPKSLKSAHSWPVLFVFNPGGGSPETLNRYIPGATRNGWALVVSVQSKNGEKRPPEEIVYPMVDEVIARFPIDDKRVYASGHSGGTRVAGLLGEHMKKKGFAGLLANGAGVGYDRVYMQSPKSSIYALCGSNCFNRWDMPKSLDQISCKNKKLVLFPGNHDWASEAYMTEGMSMLTGWFLKDAGGMSTPYATEITCFVERELEELKSLKETQPGKALMWAQLLSEFKLPAELSEQVRKEAAALRTNKEALTYQEAEKALDALMKKHFIVSDHARCMKRADPAASKAAKALAEQYADTPFAEVFRRLAEPSV